MKRMFVIKAVIIILLSGCMKDGADQYLHKDLIGKQLANDDFSIVFLNKKVKSFLSVDELLAIYPKAVRTENDKWNWSVNISSGSMTLKNIEYRLKGVKFVYFRDEVNEYAGILSGALTIRGIRIGDSYKDVLEKYGRSYYGNEDDLNFITEDSGLEYRFYKYPESSGEEYKLFDYIYFETSKGVVVGIHFWRKYSDAI